MQGKIYGIALGPGDPELITMKGFNLLKSADVIYYPGSIGKGGKEKSFAGKIMESYGLDHDKMKGIFISMSLNRQKAEEKYSEAFEEMVKDFELGKKVVVVSEGDIAMYSTFGYLIERFRKREIPYEMVPGIPAFIAAGSAGGFPLAFQTDKILVLSQLSDTEKLGSLVENFETIVIMKVSTIKKELTEFLKTRGLKFFYGEKIGTQEEFSTTDIEVLEEREKTYFSILIINKYL